MTNAFNKLRRKIKVAVRNAVMNAGVDLYRRSPDRRVLQRTIMPYLAAMPDCRRVLFVGCDWYTRGYRQVFANHEYWTLDYDPEKSRFGSDKHIVDSVVNVSVHFDCPLDLILCNGVFGYGLNDRESVSRAFAACRNSLRPGGVFLLGWNDVPDRRPFDPLESLKAAGFTPYRFPPLATERHRVPMRTRHVYDFALNPSG